jgi:hypothetical protein
MPTESLAKGLARVRPWMAKNDVFFTFTLYGSKPRLNGYDRAGDAIWSATARQSPLCDKLYFPFYSPVGSLNLLCPCGPYLECRQCEGNGARWSVIEGHPHDLYFAERGRLPDRLQQQIAAGTHLDVYDLEPGDFAWIVGLTAVRRAFLTPLFSP